MGIHRYGLDMVSRAKKTLNKKYKELRIVELGAQVLRKDTKATRGIWAKTFFERLGAVHVSLDVGGKGRSLSVDLRDPIEDKKLLGSFDILTNFGTSEHVWAEQYGCWRNCHELVHHGGIFLHEVPCHGRTKSHAYYTYEPAFFTTLAELCGYKILWLADTYSISRPWIAESDKKALWNILTGIQKEGSKAFVDPEIFQKQLACYIHRTKKMGRLEMGRLEKQDTTRIV